MLRYIRSFSAVQVENDPEVGIIIPDIEDIPAENDTDTDEDDAVVE